MARNRFVGLDTVRLDLSEGDYIVVKQAITFEESEKLNAAGFNSSFNMDGTPNLAVDWVKFKFNRFETWLVEWSFTNGDGKPVDLTPQAIRSLDPATAAEIEAALDKHVAAQEEQGKAPTGKPARGKS